MPPLPPIHTLKVALRDAVIIVVLSAGVALAYNQVRSTGGIALLAEREYEVLVPCPEFEGEADAVAAGAVDPGEKGLLLVDAREAEAHAGWHAPGAVSIPYDFLEPTSPELLRKVLDRRPRRVVVYGDGENPDSGEQLARELSGKGIRNVSFVTGGAPALRRALSGAGGALTDPHGSGGGVAPAASCPAGRSPERGGAGEGEMGRAGEARRDRPPAGGSWVPGTRRIGVEHEHEHEHKHKHDAISPKQQENWALWASRWLPAAVVKRCGGAGGDA